METLNKSDVHFPVARGGEGWMRNVLRLVSRLKLERAREGEREREHAIFTTRLAKHSKSLSTSEWRGGEVERELTRSRPQSENGISATAIRVL